MQLREEFFNIDSELYTIYLSNHRTAELPPLPSFYDIPQQPNRYPNTVTKVLQERVPSQHISHEHLQGISIASQALCLYVACDEIDFPLRLELWDMPPKDLDVEHFSQWFYVAEVSFDLSNGELYLHGLMDHNVAKPIYIAPDTYRCRFYLGSLEHLDKNYILTHWSIFAEDEEEDDPQDEQGKDLDSRLHDPDRNLWCRLVLWPSPNCPPCMICSPP